MPHLNHFSEVPALELRIEAEMIVLFFSENPESLRRKGKRRTSQRIKLESIPQNLTKQLLNRFSIEVKDELEGLPVRILVGERLSAVWRTRVPDDLIQVVH